MPAPDVAFELTLDPDAASRLLRLPVLAHREGRVRTTTIALTWYDTPDAVLAADGTGLCERRLGRETTWRLERLRNTAETPWIPGTPPPVLAEAPSPADLGYDLPAPLLPIAGFSGRLRSAALATEAGPVSLAVLHGTLRAVAGERPACRVLLSGPPDAVAPLALAIAETVPLSVPSASLAADAYAVAERTMEPPALGAPELPADITVADAFARVAGHLTWVLLHWAPFAVSGTTQEPVHQMRVALRRLRSAVSLFRNAVGTASLDETIAALRALMSVLGPARDWDVFCTGTGQAVGSAFPDDRAVLRLLAAAEKVRRGAYRDLRAYLESPAYRLLGIRLACLVALRPWEQAQASDDAASLRAAPLADFAARALTRRWDRVRKPTDDFAALPVEALHALRIQSKRLRYAAEFFAPLFPRKETRRFIRRVTLLQDRLGHLNDGAVADALMARLGHGGAERAMAIGIVRGFVAGGMRGAREKGEQSWRKLRRLDPFWE